jgi:hypothetical protein
MTLVESATLVGIIVAVITVTMLHVAYAVYFERKVVAHMQARLGPMRVGPHGLLQPIADGVKLFFKEDLIPSTADKSIYFIAPVITAFAALASLAVVPFTDSFAIAHINIGLLYILALSSLGAYGVILGGWSSNSKYAFLGSLRSAAQVISYEIAMGLSLIGVVLLAGSTDLLRLSDGRHRRDQPAALRSPRSRDRARGGLFHRVHGLPILPLFRRRVRRDVRHVGVGDGLLPGWLAWTGLLDLRDGPTRCLVHAQGLRLDLLLLLDPGNAPEVQI